MRCWINTNRMCDTDCPAHLTLEASKADGFVHGLNLWQEGGLFEKEYAGMRTRCSLIYSIFVFADSFSSFPLNEKNHGCKESAKT